MTQSVEGSALEGQGCATAGHDPNLLGNLILDGALDGLFKGIQWDIEQRYVTTSQTTQIKTGPTGTGPDLQ
jgi:hypothetical protein